VPKMRPKPMAFAADLRGSRVLREVLQYLTLRQ
jgi:hypothetical protein